MASPLGSGSFSLPVDMKIQNNEMQHFPLRPGDDDDMLLYYGEIYSIEALYPQSRKRPLFRTVISARAAFETVAGY